MGLGQMLYLDQILCGILLFLMGNQIKDIQLHMAQSIGLHQPFTCLLDHFSHLLVGSKYFILTVHHPCSTFFFLPVNNFLFPALRFELVR